MNNFGDFNITPTDNSPFPGDFIKMKKLFDKEIIVHKYRITKSEYTDQRLDLQITFKNELLITWTGSRNLIDMIKQVPENKFPFKTIIIIKNQQYVFTAV